MRVISRKKLITFAQVHPNARIPLDTWYRIIKSATYSNLVQLKQTFPSADYVDGKVVFNIGGNKYRLIAVIHYDVQKLFIRHVLTHAEYDKGDWK